LKRFPFGLNSRDHAGICVHENQLYHCVYGGGIYRVNADGSDTLVVNQNRNWYALISAFGKLYSVTNTSSASGIYEIDPYAGTAVLRYSVNNVYCITQFKSLLYFSSNATGYLTELLPGAWTVINRGLPEVYRSLSPSADGASIVAAAARPSGNFGGVLKTYNTSTWVGASSGLDIARNGLVLNEDSLVMLQGAGAEWLFTSGNVFGTTERSMSASSQATPGAYAFTRYNSSYYVSGWTEKIYKFPFYTRRPLGDKLIAAVGAPQRNFNYGLCATPDGILVAGSFEYATDAVFTSVDAGETWTARTTPNTIAPMQILAAPLSGSIGYRLVCVGEGGIMTSDDRGNTWTSRSTGNNFNCICRDASDGALYAGGYSGVWGYTATSLIYKSTDNGVSWSSNFSSAAGGMIQGLAYNSTLQKLVAVTFYGANQVYVSSNHGSSWVANSAVQKQYWRGVIFDNHRGFMLAWTAGLGDGSAYVMRSSDGGSNWTYDSTNVGFNDVIAEPGGRLLGCRNGEIYAADNGLDFVQLPGAAAGIWAKLVYSPYHDIVAACAVTGAARFMTSLSGRRTPRRIWWSYASAPQRAFNQGLLGTPSGRILATATEYSTTSVVYSDDVGLTWNTATTSNAVAPMSMIQIPYQNSIGYRIVATCETAPGLNPAMYSDDNGVTWTLASLAGVRGVIHLCRDHSTGYLFAVGYAGSDTSDTATTEILRSTDAGVTWTSVYTNVGGGLGVRIAYDPLRNRLCAITRNGVNHSYVSSDSGATWTPYAGSATRPWRDMCWDAARGCLVKVCHEGTRTASILGTTYNTVILPDGKEWMATNLKWTGAGQWWSNAGSDDGDGRYYTANEAWTTLATALVGSDWRAPTLAEFTAMMEAAGGASLAGGRLKSTGTTLWNAPNTGSSNIYGFSLIGSGRYWVGAWDYKRSIVKLWLSADFSVTAYYGSDVNAQTLWTGADPAYTGGRLPIRLVRDYTPTSEHMYRSFDGGITWSPVPGVLPAQSVVAERSGRLFTAGIGTGMRSDNGVDWSTISVDSASWRKLALLERHDKIIGIANLGLNRFMLTGNT
jgi:uncharacterized protein (TIGR02145 family)